MSRAQSSIDRDGFTQLPPLGKFFYLFIIYIYIFIKLINEITYL